MGFDPKDALLVGVIMPDVQDVDYEESLQELAELAVNLDYKVKETLLVKIRKPTSR